jgi:hypothetical protein
MSVAGIRVGHPKFIGVREAFKWEAHEFTPWLENNLEILDERLGNLGLELIEREKSVGDFSCDLLCKDKTGNLVVIENQLESTDHTHLGQVLMYLVNLDAKTAIWISPSPRPEHMEVIKWLNKTTPEDMSFYLVKVEALCALNPDGSSSAPIPLFTMLVWPDHRLKDFGLEKKQLANRHHARKEFWRLLIERINSKGIKLFSKIQPSYDHWIAAASGKAGIHYSYAVYIDGAGGELWIDKGKERVTENKDIFDKLFAQKEAIEQETGIVLEWDRKNSNRSCSIKFRILQSTGIYDEEHWEDMQEEMISIMEKFYKAIQPRIRNF